MSLYAYFLYVIGTSVLVIVCVGVIFVALVFYSKKWVDGYNILVYGVYMAGSMKSAGISTASLGYY